MNHRCYFCEKPPTNHYTITKYFHLIEPICSDCFIKPRSESPFKYTSYQRIATLEEAEETLIRIKLFGEEP